MTALDVRVVTGCHGPLVAADGQVTAAARLLGPVLAGGAARLGHGPLAAFSAALIIRCL